MPATPPLLAGPEPHPGHRDRYQGKVDGDRWPCGHVHVAHQHVRRRDDQRDQSDQPARGHPSVPTTGAGRLPTQAASLISRMTATPTPTNCPREATNGSLLNWNAVVAAAPSTKSTPNTLSPTRPNHGSRRRCETDSTSTIGTVMLHSVWIDSTKIVHGAPMPRARHTPAPGAPCSGSPSHVAGPPRGSGRPRRRTGVRGRTARRVG
jgi:hypothetical protein